MVPEQSAGTESAPRPEPLGIQVASTLCWIVGIVTIATAFLLGLPAATGVFGILLVFVNLVAGVAVCIAGYLIRRRRRLGAQL